MTTWPNPDKPGYPLNYEVDGWHWVITACGFGHPFPMSWDAIGRMWDAGDAGWVHAEDFATRWRYLGPCIPPDELTAREQAAATMRALDAERDALLTRAEAAEELARWYRGEDAEILALVLKHSEKRGGDDE